MITILNLASDEGGAVANVRLMFPDDVPIELAEGTLTLFNCRMHDFIRTHGYVDEIEFQNALKQELRELNRLLKTWRATVDKLNYHSLYCYALPEDFSYMHSFMYRRVF